MKFEERRAECRTDTQHLVNLSAYHWALQCLARIAEIRVLDAACGTGYGSYALAARAHEVVGVDRDGFTIREASRRYRRANLRFLTMDCQALAFKDESFGAVVSFETIEHLDDDRQFLREVTRVLAPDGQLVISTPHGKAPGAVPDNPWHRREYTWDELHMLLAEHFQSVRFFGRCLGPRLATLEHELDKVRQFDPPGSPTTPSQRAAPPYWQRPLAVAGGMGLEEVTPADVEYIEGCCATPTLLAVCQEKVQ